MKVKETRVVMIEMADGKTTFTPQWRGPLKLIWHKFYRTWWSSGAQERISAVEQFFTQKEADDCIQKYFVTRERARLAKTVKRKEIL